MQLNIIIKLVVPTENSWKVPARSARSPDDYSAREVSRRFGRPTKCTLQSSCAREDLHGKVSRAMAERMSLKRLTGPYFVSFPNLREALSNNTPIKTDARSCTILPHFVGWVYPLLSQGGCPYGMQDPFSRA